MFIIVILLFYLNKSLGHFGLRFLKQVKVGLFIRIHSLSFARTSPTLELLPFRKEKKLVMLS